MIGRWNNPSIKLSVVSGAAMANMVGKCALTAQRFVQLFPRFAALMVSHPYPKAWGVDKAGC